MTDISFWLIERGPNEGVPQHQWWNEGPAGSVMGWKSSVHEATRYQSKEAAARVVRANRGLRDLPTAITSHSFFDANAGAKEDQRYCSSPAPEECRLNKCECAESDEADRRFPKE